MEEITRSGWPKRLNQSIGQVMVMAIDHTRDMYTLFRDNPLVVGREQELFMEIACGEHDSRLRSLYNSDRESPDTTLAYLIEAHAWLVKSGALIERDGVWVDPFSFEALAQLETQLGLRRPGSRHRSVAFTLPGGVRFTSTHPTTKAGITRRASKVNVHRLSNATVSYNHGSCRFSPAEIVWPGTGGYWRHGMLTPAIVESLLEQAPSAAQHAA